MRIYVINASNLISAAQRQFRIIAFGPIEVKATVDIMGVSKVSQEILSADMVSDEGCIMSFSKAIHPVTAPGSALDEMNTKAVEIIAAKLDSQSIGGSTTIHIFEWIRDLTIIASTDAVYGPHNPFRDPAAVDAYLYVPVMTILRPCH